MPKSGHPTRRQLIAASAALAAWPAARAQGAKFPSKQIRIVVPFPPGGLTDAYARMFGEQLTQQMHRQIEPQPELLGQDVVLVRVLHQTRHAIIGEARVGARCQLAMDLLIAATAHAHAARPYTRHAADLVGTDHLIEIVAVRARR